MSTQQHASNDLVVDPAEFVRHVPGRVWLAPCKLADDEVTVSGFDFSPNCSTLRTNRHAVVAYRQSSTELQRWASQDAARVDAQVGLGDMSLKDCRTAGGWAWATEISVAQIHIDPRLLRRTAAEMHGASHADVRLRDNACLRDELLLGLVHALVDEASNRQPGWRAMARALTCQLAVHLVRHHCETMPLASDGGLQRLHREQLDAHIANHLDGDLSVSALAAFVHLSPDHFSRCFRASFDCAPQQYVLRARLGLARELLREGSAPLAIVAAQAGFSDQSHLCRWFKRAYGVTPGNWRALKTVDEGSVQTPSRNHPIRDRP